MIKLAASCGVCISLGHSNATLEEAEVGIDAGARHATHTFNAMRQLDHREPGVLGAVLANDRVTAVLITDAISATGMGDGKFRLGGFEVEVTGDRCEYEGNLAGSVLTLDRAIR